MLDEKYWLEKSAHTLAHAVNPISVRESVCLPRELGQIIQFVRFENNVWIANLWRTFPVEKRERHNLVLNSNLRSRNRQAKIN